jgi:hypothetical protein
MSTNILSDEKMKVIDIILDMYPDLKKNKVDIINTVYGKLVRPYNYVFTKIFINNKEYYIDPTDAIYDKNIVFRGFIAHKKIYLIDDINDEIKKEFNSAKDIILK